MHLPASLRKVPFLSDLNDSSFESVLSDAILLEFEAGETVLSEGAEGAGFYVLLSGALDVIKDGVTVGKITEWGDIVGEMSLATGEPRAATVVAKEKTFCLRTSRSILDELEGEEKIAYEAALYRFLTMLLIQRLQATNERVAELETQLQAPAAG